MPGGSFVDQLLGGRAAEIRSSQNAKQQRALETIMNIDTDEAERGQNQENAGGRTADQGSKGGSQGSQSGRPDKSQGENGKQSSEGRPGVQSQATAAMNAAEREKAARQGGKTPGQSQVRDEQGRVAGSGEDAGDESGSTDVANDAASKGKRSASAGGSSSAD